MRSRPDRRRFLAAAVASAFLAIPGVAPAQVAPGNPFEVPMLDPWVPPEVRAKARAAPAAETEGEALRAQVRAKLKRRFDAAAGPTGALSANQARAAGLGGIADHFDAIDRSRRGAIRFEDYERYLSGPR